jgi:hypothetical protein
MPQELISRKTRTEFCEHLVGWTLRTIRNEFDSADIACDDDYHPAVSGERRTLVLQYYHTLDLTKPGDAKKLLQAFENVLNVEMERIEALTQADPYGELEAIRRAADKLCKLLQRDGYQYKNGRILPLSPTASLHLLKEAAVVFNADYLADQVRRLEQAVDSDPAQAIGTAKELVETCCYTILSERGKPAADKPDLLPLVRRTLEELKLVPDGIADAQKGAKSIKSLLGNLAVITQSLAELRNLYGTGHGKDGKMKGLSTRHARLAVGAATTLAVFLFDTHQERGGVS